MSAMRPFHVWRLVVVVLLAGAWPAAAQSPCREVSAQQLFTGTLDGLRHVSSRRSAEILALGAGAALSAHAVDGDVTQHFAGRTRNEAFKAGPFLGSTPFELGVGVAIYGIGRAGGHSCAAELGAELVQAQLLASGLTVALKQATQRSRPEGSGLSFPSGHTTAAFASATVLERHFGWKVGLPAYAVASYVAASRIEMRRHYLSDIAFGAALGIVAGRAVSIGHGQRLLLTPVAPADGAGAGLGFTWIPRD